MRSVGSGNYFSVHTFAVVKDKLIYRGAVAGLAANADLLTAVRRSWEK